VVTPPRSNNDSEFQKRISGLCHDPKKELEIYSKLRFVRQLHWASFSLGDI